MTNAVAGRGVANRSPARRSGGEIVLSVEGVAKKFCRSLKRSLYYGLRDIGTEMTGRRRSEHLRPGEFRALDDVSFELRRGDAVGLVGPNGAGKSTLIRIISGLIRPDAGAVRIRGRVAPLIALGAGFNPVLTGRENVYANMSILGLTRKEIDERFDEVLAFAEIGDAIDAPVQTYSSGMAARLGFACAAYTSPDILLIDEVLAVGDIKFRMKCYRRLGELRESGTTFVLVSHNPQAILMVCDAAIYLSGGKLVEFGATDAIITRYEEDLFARDGAAEQTPGLWRPPEKSAGESTGLDIASLSFVDEHGQVVASPASGQPVTFRVSCKGRRDFHDVNVTLLVREQLGEGELLLRLATSGDGKSFETPRGEFDLLLRMPYLSLRPGPYTIKLSVSQGTLYLLDAVESFQFRVGDSEGMQQCAFYQPREWEIVKQAEFTHRA